ncbi:MAG: D-alanyl-D-alanine carboxypeptidase/D-alanyl-D-alanine-endopeptidase [Deltaproteobacteria bacterium]|nr:D-alanyl-D-alanine carboxypeptidase/D-alanyl-D-alanine-endopeptidase [Deltaproteobacteria bacterium]
MILVGAAAIAASLLLSFPSASQAPPASSPAASQVAPKQQAAIAKAVDKFAAAIAKYGGKTGVSVVDVETGQVIASYHDREALNPASNMKLLTAAAAMSQLTATYQYRTALYGKRNGAAVDELVLRGSGDPSLTTSDLWEMAAELRRSGVRKVQGDILVDQSAFDEQYLPPGFEQQPNEWAYFRAPVSAVALNRNVITMSVHPTTKEQAAVVSFDPPGVVDVTGSVKTSAAGPEAVTLLLAPSGARLSAKVGGTIPEDSHAMVTPKRIDNPSVFAGYALRALLAEQGITVSGAVRTGGDKARNVLVMHRSRPLSELLYELGKRSDNFYAEMVFKGLGSKEKSRGQSSADGAEVVNRYLKAVGALDDGTVIKNGSGLYDTNRVTANTFTRVLRAAYLDPSFGSEYVSHLAIGGVDGTLHGRFNNLKKLRLVRAKTGTLNDVTALSGYVLSPGSRAPFAFSIVINGVAGKVTGARAALDKCASSIASAMLRSKGVPAVLPSGDDE